jgi:hypothetical protein
MTLKTSLYCSLRKDGITGAELSRRLKWNRGLSIACCDATTHRALISSERHSGR